MTYTRNPLFTKKYYVLATCLLLLIGVMPHFTSHATQAPIANTIVKIPYMKRAGKHLIYTNALLQLALDATEEEYGAYSIIQQETETVIRRQQRDLESGKYLSLAISMPSPQWLNKTKIIRYPIMKGMASYRMFFASRKHEEFLNGITSLNLLKTVKIGQGPGWSTGKILEDNGFSVIYGGPYQTLIPMLNSERYRLLMRGVYEIEPEFNIHSKKMPELTIVDNIAVYTYLPMYFFVSLKHPKLAERLELGLKKVHASGKSDKLFKFHFNKPLQLLKTRKRKVFYLNNSNIDASFFERDKPYLLDTIRTLGEHNPANSPP